MRLRRSPYPPLAPASTLLRWVWERWRESEPDANNPDSGRVMGEPEELRRCRCGVLFYTRRHMDCAGCRKARPKPAKVLTYPAPGRLPR